MRLVDNRRPRHGGQAQQQRRQPEVAREDQILPRASQRAPDREREVAGATVRGRSCHGNDLDSQGTLASMVRLCLFCVLRVFRGHPICVFRVIRGPVFLVVRGPVFRAVQRPQAVEGERIPRRRVAVGTDEERDVMPPRRERVARLHRLDAVGALEGEADIG